MEPGIVIFFLALLGAAYLKGRSDGVKSVKRQYRELMRGNSDDR